MRKLLVTLAIASLVAAVAVAKTQMNEEHPSYTPAAGTAGTYQPPVHQRRAQRPPTQESTTVDKPTSRNPEPDAIRERLDAAMVPYGEAVKLARELFFERKFEDAEVECRRALALAPIINGKPWYGAELPLLGDILLARGSNHDALEAYLRVTTSSKPDDPEHPRPNLGAALAYCRLGNFEMAKKYCPQHDSPKWREVWSNDIRGLEASLLFARASDEDSMENSRGAILYLEPAAKLAPKNWLIARAMGDVLCDLKRYKEAASYFLRAEQQGGKIAYEEHQLAHPEKYLSVPAKR